MKPLRTLLIASCVCSLVIVMAACGEELTPTPAATELPVDKSPSATATQTVMLQPGDEAGGLTLNSGPPQAEGPPVWAPRSRPLRSGQTAAGIGARRDETATPASSTGRTAARPEAGRRGRWLDPARGRQGVPQRARPRACASSHRARQRLARGR